MVQVQGTSRCRAGLAALLLLVLLLLAGAGQACHGVVRAAAARLCMEGGQQPATAGSARALLSIGCLSHASHIKLATRNSSSPGRICVHTQQQRTWMVLKSTKPCCWYSARLQERGSSSGDPCHLGQAVRHAKVGTLRAAGPTLCMPACSQRCGGHTLRAAGPALPMPRTPWPHLRWLEASRYSGSPSRSASLDRWRSRREPAAGVHAGRVQVNKVKQLGEPQPPPHPHARSA